MIRADGLNGELPGLTFVLRPVGMCVSVCKRVSMCRAPRLGKTEGGRGRGNRG